MNLRSVGVRISLFLAGVMSLAAQTNPFEADIRRFEASDRSNPPPPNALLFLGSSTIVRWDTLAAAFPRFDVLNRGFGGSQAGDVLFYYDRVVLPYRAPLIAYYEGDNDLAGGRTVDQVFGDWTNLVNRVQRDLPDSDLLYIAVKPSPSRAGLLTRQRELNDRVRAYNASRPRLLYADVFAALLSGSGQPRPELYVSDQLHLSPAGYAVWESVLVPVVEAWAARYPVNVLKPRRGALQIDLGSASSPSGLAHAPARHWNNVATVGTTDAGVLPNLVSRAGAPTNVRFRMTSRFNGANENGTTAAAVFPASATRDSLFGNTESFGGLANVTPAFRLEGLTPGTRYRLTFHASRLGVSDRRETRYSVTGASQASVLLDAANNVESVAILDGLEPAGDGSLAVALSPGPGNNNANHFTYLGVLQIECPEAPETEFLIDFGSAASPTGTQPGTPTGAWNNLTPAIGATDDGALDALIDTEGRPTPVGWRMRSRFNAANENGTTESTRFPASATVDSLFGNTEPFAGLGPVTPRFRLVGLDSGGRYTLTFFAARGGVGDRRETRYTVTGRSTAFADLEPANNVSNVAILPDVEPDSTGEIAVDLAPGPANDNANHFTYLGVLHLAWTIPAPRAPFFTDLGRGASGAFRSRIHGTPGVAYQVQTSVDLAQWTNLRPLETPDGSVVFESPASAPAAFFRVVAP